MKNIIGQDEHRQKVRDNKRIIRILIGVFTSFVVLTAPIRLLPLISVDKINLKIYEALSYTLILYPLHTVVNPIVYCIVEPEVA